MRTNNLSILVVMPLLYMGISDLTTPLQGVPRLGGI
jgi:hypothetical protein